MLFVQQALLHRKIPSLQIGVQILCQRNMMKINYQHYTQASLAQFGPSPKPNEGVSVLWMMPLSKLVCMCSTSFMCLLSSQCHSPHSVAHTAGLALASFLCVLMALYILIDCICSRTTEQRRRGTQQFLVSKNHLFVTLWNGDTIFWADREGFWRQRKTNTIIILM